MKHGGAWGRRGRPARRLLVAAGVVFCVGPSVSGAEPAYSFHSPFHPQQCDRAIDAGHRQLDRDPSDGTGRMLVAEGLLCRGLEDDPGALDAAIGMLRQIAADQPAHFFAQLELADALRKRFPLSDDAQAALLRARDLLQTADVGAARQELTDYIDENLAAVAQHRAGALPFLEESAQRLATNTLSPAEMAGFISVLAQTGPEGLLGAEQRLDTYLMRHTDDALATLYRAELLRGRVLPETSRRLYAEAEARLCDRPRAEAESPECRLARSRERQLREREADE